MSRTYATLPFHVAARRFGYEDHDHSSGTCTLWMDAAQKLPYGHAQRCKKRPVFEVTCEHRGPVCLTTTVRFTDGTSAAPLSGCSREGEVAALADYPSTARWSHVRRVVFDSPAAACACDTLLDPRKQNCFYRLERWHTGGTGRCRGCWWCQPPSRVRAERRAEKVRLRALVGPLDWDAMLGW